jgi:hypothetical protein
MSAQALIAKAEQQGITLRLQEGAIAWQSNKPPPDELLAELAAHKAEIVIALMPNNLLPLSANDTYLVNAWLDLIGEKDPAQRRFVMQRCASNPVALRYVLGMAADAEVALKPLPEPYQPAATQVYRSILETVHDLPLLPDDKLFLSDLLHSKTEAEQSKMLVEYRRQWDLASTVEVLAHRRDNAGRRAANTRIRRNETHGKSPQGSQKGWYP